MVKAREESYRSPSEAKAQAKSKRLERLRIEWENLLNPYVDLFSCSFSGTFARQIEDPRQVSERGRKFQRILNKICAGSSWEENQDGLLSAFSVEIGIHSSRRLHTYFLIGDHPLINPPFLKELWIKRIDPNVDPDALSVTPRDDNFESKAIPYFAKQIGIKPNWPMPFFFVPRPLKDLKLDEKGRYINPLGGKNDIPRLMTVEELVERIRVSPSTITNLIQKRTIPHYSIGRKILFNPADVKHWLDSNRVSPTPQTPTNSEVDNDMTAKIDQLMRDVDIKKKSNSIRDLV